MSSPETNVPVPHEAPKPNDPKLFGTLLRTMVDITHQDGYEFPATTYTDEELEMF